MNSVQAPRNCSGTAPKHRVLASFLPSVATSCWGFILTAVGLVLVPFPCQADNAFNGDWWPAYHGLRLPACQNCIRQHCAR